jgi:hypothetical protein
MADSLPVARSDPHKVHARGVRGLCHHIETRRSSQVRGYCAGSTLPNGGASRYESPVLLVRFEKFAGERAGCQGDDASNHAAQWGSETIFIDGIWDDTYGRINKSSENVGQG